VALLAGADADAALALEALEARHPQACSADDLAHLACLQAEQGRHGQAERICARGQSRFPDTFRGIRSFRQQHLAAARPAPGAAQQLAARLRLLVPVAPPSRPRALAAAEPPVSLYSWPGYLRSNAFMLLLQAGLQEAGARYIGLDMPSRALPRGADLLLIQFPDVLGWREAPEALPLRMREELAALAAWRRQGSCLLWLVHNVLPHDLSPGERRLWRGFHRRLGRLCDGFLAMGPSLRRPVEAAIPALAGKPFASFLHPRYPIAPLQEAERRRCRAGLGVGEGELLVGALGTISRYKGLPALVRMLRDLGRSDVRLLIAGQPRSSGILAELEEAIGGDPAVLLQPGHLPADQFAAFTQACDRIVIPNERYLTSGALLYALSAGRPVLARLTPYSADVRAALGTVAGHLHLHERELDPASLRRFLEQPPPAVPPDLEAFSSLAAGRAILALHATIRGASATAGRESG
jgi:glycosyltransferase involved in cell wall biosynthesis